MVKVLPCHNFKSQRVLCPKAEPVALYCSIDTLFVATQKSFIEVYSLTGEDEACVCSFQTLGVVHELLYSPHDDYVVTVEKANTREKPSVNHVLVYDQWREWKVGASIRLVFLQPGNALDTSTSGSFVRVPFNDITLKEHVLEESGIAKKPHNIQRDYFKAIRVSVADWAQCVAIDSETGTLAVGNKSKVSLYRFVPVEGQAEVSRANLTCLLELNVSFNVTELNICEEFVLCRCENEAQVIQISLNVSESSEKLTDFLLQRNSVYNRYKEDLDFVSGYLKDEGPQPKCDKSVPDKFAAYSASGRKIHGPFKDDAYVSISELLNEDSNNLAANWLSARRIANERGDGTRDIILGPIQNHPRCSVFIAYKDKAVAFHSEMESDLLTNLFISFEDKEITSAQLLPIYCEAGLGSSEEPCKYADLISSKRDTLLAVMCLISTNTEGYLYIVGGQRTRLVQTYNYTTQGTRMARMTYGHLYVSTLSGIGIYSVHAVAKALYDAGIRDQTIAVKQREACMVGIQPFVSIQSMSLSANHMAVLSKVTDDKCGVPAEAFWSIYILELPQPLDTYHDTYELCEFHKTRSEVLYAFLLEEMYYSLRAQRVLQHNNLAQIQAALSDVAFSLAKVCSSPNAPVWKAAVSYYLTSQKPIVAVIAINDEPPGKGLWNFLDFILFESEKLEIEENVTLLLLELYARWRASVLSHALVSSNVLMKLCDNIVRNLRVEFEKQIENDESDAMNVLALSVICVRLNDIEAVQRKIANIKQEKLVEVFTDFPNLLVECNNQPTVLSEFLRKHHPDTLVDILVASVENNTLTVDHVSTLFNYAKSNEDRNNPQFLQILERLSCDSKNGSVFVEIVPVLLKIYLHNLASFREKGNGESQAKYIIPKRGGLFRNRYKWLDDIPPLQGTVALTKACQIGSAQSIPCPCTACNATLLKLQCLLCSSEMNQNDVQYVLQQVETNDILYADSIKIQSLFRGDLRQCMQILMHQYVQLVPSIIEQTLKSDSVKLAESAELIFDILNEEESFNNDSSKKVLQILSEVLQPDAFINLVNKHNRLTDCAEYIRLSVKTHQAQLMKQQITDFATALLLNG